MATRLIQTGQEVQNILNNAIELFWAKYGETTYAEIDAAVASGALVACMHDSSAYFYSGIAEDNNTMVFSKFGASATPPSVDTILLNIGNNQWSEGDNFPLENVGNKIKTTDSHPEYQLESDDKYLSSKSTSLFFNRRASALQLTGGHVMYIHLGSLVTTDLPFYRVWYGDGTGAPYGEIIIELQKRLVSWTPPDAAEYAYAIKAINIGTTDSVAVSFVQASGYYWLKISVPSDGTRNAPFYVTASDGSEARVSQSCGGTETEIVAATVVNFASSAELANYMPKSGGRFSGTVIFEDRASFESPISLDEVQIHGLADPTSGTDAANKQYVDSGLSTKASASDVSDINAKIPAQASAQNQLADKNFVNSSIQTNTATFQGNYDTWDDVPDYWKGYPNDTRPDSNDYLVVRDASGYAPQWNAERTYVEGDIVSYDAEYSMYRCLADVDEPGISPDNNPQWEGLYVNPNYEGTWRFKYAGTWSVDGKWGWLPEYQVNEKPLTAAQLAALNSGITDTKVAKLDALPTKPVDTQAQVLTDAEKNQARSNIGAGLAMISRTINANGSLAMKINTSCSLLITLYRTTAPIAQAVLLFQAYPQSGSLVCKCVLLSGEINNQSFNFDSVKAYGTYNGMWAGITQGSGLNITASIMSLDGGFPVDFADSFPGSLASTTPIEIKVGVVAQTLSDSQKAQARENIGAMTVVRLTKEEYDALEEKDDYSLYDVLDDGSDCLTIEAINDANVYFGAPSDMGVGKIIEVSTDGGITWVQKASSLGEGTVIASLAAGEKVLLRGNNSAYGYYDDDELGDYVGAFFAADDDCYVYGNVMSLVGGGTSVQEYAFTCLFYDYNNNRDGSWLHSKPGKPILLPATTLAQYCYEDMFNGCTSLTTAPELPATTLESYCYRYMFSGCSSLNYVKALFTTIGSSSLLSWLYNVSATGTFVKHPDATIPSGDSGIPSGWTVETATE